MANGKVIYPSGTTPQTTYNFVKNFDYSPTFCHLETDDNARTLDGTLNSYAGPRKKTFELTFTMALKAQFDYFRALWSLQCPIDLYLDGVNLDATVKIMTPPSGTAESAFATPGEPTYTFTVTMEEV